MLNTLHWPDEIRSSGELAIPQDGADIHKRELDMAVMLVENLSAHFDPERHHDEYREAVIKVVEAKLGNRPVERLPERETAKVTDLMAALKASVEAAQAGRGEQAETVPAKRRKAS